MSARAFPFLMFQGGVARAAIEFYVSLFDDGRIDSMSTYGADGPGPEGTVQLARFHLAGQDLLASDSFVAHAFDFTPSLSIWIQTESETQLRDLATVLADGGQVLMPVDDYAFSVLFGWIKDRFGVSWQLNLT